MYAIARPAKTGPMRPRAVKCSRIERNGIKEMPFADHLKDERLPRRHVKGIYCAEKNAKKIT